MCVGGLVKQEHTAMMVLRCKLKSTVEGRRSSLNENTILIEMMKKKGVAERRKHTRERPGMGPAASCYKAGLSHGGKIQAPAVSRHKLSIDFNGWASKGGSEWCEREGPDFFSICASMSNAGRGK